MDLKPELVDALTRMKITKPTDIQAESIPKILLGDHFLGQARTGSGKTLAYCIPLAQMIDPNKLECLILVPTRELCKQVHDVFRDLLKFSNLTVVEVYGGVSIERQIAEIEKGANIIVATPGRLIDIYMRKKVSFRTMKYVVLDEADRMLDMGFMPDLEFILIDSMQAVGISTQLILFSATLFLEIQDLAKRFIGEDDFNKVNVSEDEMTVKSCSQYYYLIEDQRDKYYDFVRILRDLKPTHLLIFVNTQKSAEWLHRRLSNERGLNLRIESISGALSQNRREDVLRKFKNKSINTLIATDVASRGLDIPDITHVINFDLPKYEEDYVHRIGRTSRMNKKGMAVSLVNKDEYRFLCRIEGFIDKTIEQKELPPREPRPYSGDRRGSGYQGRNPGRANIKSGSYDQRSNQKSGQRQRNDRYGGSQRQRRRDSDQDSSQKEGFNPFF